MQCPYCGWYNGRHADNCPEGNTEAKARWEAGWDEGRSGVQNPSSEDSVFQMGFNQGVCAKENAENGYMPGVDGGQW